jgi:hypothetical protein
VKKVGHWVAKLADMMVCKWVDCLDSQMVGETALQMVGKMVVRWACCSVALKGAMMVGNSAGLTAERLVCSSVDKKDDWKAGLRADWRVSW